MGLPSGAFDQRITIQRKQSTRGSMGQEIVTWVDHVLCWARVEPLRGREFFAAAQLQSATDHRITIRYRSGITRDMRVVWRGIALEIAGDPIDVFGAHENLELMCISGIRNG